MVSRKRGNSAQRNEYICSRCKCVEKRPAKTVPRNKSSISYLESVSKVSDEEAANGFLDENGERVYIVEDVLKISSDGKYLVKWQGYPKSEASWIPRKDMPTDRVIREKMLKLKKQLLNVKASLREDSKVGQE